MIDAQNKTYGLYEYKNGIGATTEVTLTRLLRHILYGDLYDGGGGNGGNGGGGIPPDEMHFTTVAGLVDYVGTQGDRIFLSNGSVVDITVTDNTVTFNAPAGRHIVKLVESAERNNYVSVGGEALVELHNFPTLSTVTKFNFATYNHNLLPNLTKVPDFLPSNITNMTGMFSYANSFNQDLSNWNVSNVTNMGYMFYNANSFNQDLSMWCVSQIPIAPDQFDLGASSWTLPRPVWGTCPAP